MKSSKNAFFRERVYEIVRKIPCGKAATYGQVAELAGKPKAARAVGALMKHNPYAPEVPCHRVVGVTGALTGFTAEAGIAKKKAMLLAEGVRFIGNRVDLNKYSADLTPLTPPE